MRKTAQASISLFLACLFLAGCSKQKDTEPLKAAPSLTLTTLTGTGLDGYANGTLAQAIFTLPTGLASDASGGLVVFDTYNNLIRTVTPSEVSTLAGSIMGYDNNSFPSGHYRDGEPDFALFNRPSDGVFNSKGELFVADSANHAIRVFRDGAVYTFVGTVAGHYDGDATEARFYQPTALAIDNHDNIYVADTLNHCIRKVAPDGTTTTVAGHPGNNGAADGPADKALFNEPSGIAVNGEGTIIYVADTANHLIRKIEDGTVTTLAGGIDDYRDEQPLGGYGDGPSEVSRLNFPTGLALAGEVLLVADTGNHRIRALTPDGYLYTLAGTGVPGDADGEALSAMLDHPTGLCYSNSTLYIADRNNNKIKRLPFTPGQLV